MNHTGCPISKFPLCFCHFLGFWSTYRGTSDMYSTALEIGYMIGTRILKIDLKIAEIIEVKVGTRHIEIYILLLRRVKKKTIWCYRCQLWLQLSHIFLNQFSKFLCLSCSQFPGLLNKGQKFLCTCSRTWEVSENKVKSDLWDTL